jgi:hypothetical protein
MDTDSRPDPPPATGSAVGLVFVGVVLCGLFTAGALGVLADRSPATRPAPAPRRAEGVADAGPTELAARIPVYASLMELLRRREAALRERDPAMLTAVWTPRSPWLARDRTEVERLRSHGRRWTGLRLTVRILGVDRMRGDQWTVLARLGRSRAELVTASGGAPVLTVPAADADYRCELVESGGRWLLAGLRPSPS